MDITKSPIIISNLVYLNKIRQIVDKEIERTIKYEPKLTNKGKGEGYNR